jgi:cell wall assembly regulator SMI1
MPNYKQLIEQIKKFAPVYQKILKSGATVAEISNFQKHIDTPIPENFLEFYKIVNGGEPYETVDVEGMCFNSLERILQSKKMFDQILAEKQAANEFFTWHTDWLPFADDYSYDTLVIDTSGKVSGLPGCVINRGKDSFEGDELPIVALSFSEYITGWAARVLDETVYQKGSTDSDTDNWIEEYEDEELPRIKWVSPKF